MDKKDKIKALIDLLKSLLLTFLTALFASLAYTLINLKQLEAWQVSFTFFAIICLLFGVCLVSFNLVKIFKE